MGVLYEEQVRVVCPLGMFARRNLVTSRMQCVLERKLEPIISRAGVLVRVV